jgi:hypothetical protein
VATVARPQSLRAANAVAWWLLGHESSNFSRVGAFPQPGAVQVVPSDQQTEERIMPTKQCLVDVLLNRLVDLCVNNVRYRDRLRVNMLILAESSQVGSHQSLFDVYHLKAASLIRLEHSTISSCILRVTLRRRLYYTQEIARSSSRQRVTPKG